MKESRRRSCWESIFPSGILEGDCPVCGSSKIRYRSISGYSFQQMHIIPASAGGSGEPWNLVPGCGCNQNVGVMNLLDWMGTKGNKQSLMRPLFLRKYKSLVPPAKRSNHDCRQLLQWIHKTYRPLLSRNYADWLLLLESDLRKMESGNEGIRSLHFSGVGKKWKRIRLGHSPRY